MESQATSFWKNGINSRPGRIKKESPRKEAKSSGSFQEFQMSVSDAWEMGDDEFCVISELSDTRTTRKPMPLVGVIQTHKKSIERAPSTSSPPPPPQPTSPQTPQPPTNLMHSKKFHYPGRVQLMKLSTGLASKNDECESKLEKFKATLEAPLLTMKELRQLSWSGVPRVMRGVTWRLLSGHLPTNLERRESVLQRKRDDYAKLVAQYFDTTQDSVEENFRLPADGDKDQDDTFHQIHIDVPRMNPQVPLFQQQWVQAMFERVLFIWAIRHPASGYVQGINDLLTPFFIVFLQELLPPAFEIEACRKEDLTQLQRDIIEADSFWCLSKFLDCIQDNYIFAQLGIQAKVNQLKELIHRIDGTLHRHLQLHGVDYLQFSFRWMNNLLTRELPLHCTIRLWDTYLSESDGFAVFQLYVCAAFLLHWREQLLQENDFQVSFHL